MSGTGEPRTALVSGFSPVHATGASGPRFDEIPLFDEGLYEIGQDVYAWMVPNGSWGESNSGLVVGDGEALLVDTLWDVRLTRDMLSAMETVLKRTPIRYVANTHADGDHFLGNELVGYAEIISSQAAWREMLKTRPASLLLLGLVGRILGLAPHGRANMVGNWFEKMVSPYAFREVNLTPARRTFTGELRVVSGGRAVELIEVGPAHTGGDILVHVPHAKVVFSGDIVFMGSTPVMWAGPVKNCLAALDRILVLGADIVVPGHGPVTDKEGVREVRAYWEYMDFNIRKRFEAGMTPAAAARNIVLDRDFAHQPFASWNSPERIMVSTHTQYRHLKGRSGHPNVIQLFDIMRRQALLAQELPDAQPSIMRMR